MRTSRDEKVNSAMYVEDGPGYTLLECDNCTNRVRHKGQCNDTPLICAGCGMEMFYMEWCIW